MHSSSDVRSRVGNTMGHFGDQIFLHISGILKLGWYRPLYIYFFFITVTFNERQAERQYQNLSYGPWLIAKLCALAHSAEIGFIGHSSSIANNQICRSGLKCIPNSPQLSIACKDLKSKIFQRIHMYI